METQAETTASPAAAKLGQKDAVFNFIKDALNGAQPAEGQKLKDLVSKDVRKVVRQRLFAAIRSGEVALAKQFTDSRLKKYCSGLINNWLTKDSRFN